MLTKNREISRRGFLFLAGEGHGKFTIANEKLPFGRVSRLPFA
jgi:hypothetical protein